jgi:uncharacterized membrane protein YhdT
MMMPDRMRRSIIGLISLLVSSSALGRANGRFRWSLILSFCAYLTDWTITAYGSGSSDFRVVIKYALSQAVIESDIVA